MLPISENLGLQMQLTAANLYMNRIRSITIVAVILISIGLIAVTALKFADTIEDAKAARSKKDIAELYSQIAAIDYNIYWIGQPDQYLIDRLGEKLIIVPGDSINDDTLPTSTSLADIKIFDENGTLVSQVKAADYASHLLIVVGEDVAVRGSDLDVLRRAAVGNHVPCYIMGRANIEAFREMMILPPRQYDEHASMLYDAFGSTVDNPIDNGDYGQWAELILGILNTPSPTPAVTPWPIGSGPSDYSGTEETTTEETATAEETAEETATAEETLAAEEAIQEQEAYVTESIPADGIN